MKCLGSSCISDISVGHSSWWVGFRVSVASTRIGGGRLALGGEDPHRSSWAALPAEDKLSKSGQATEMSTAKDIPTRRGLCCCQFSPAFWRKLDRSDQGTPSRTGNGLRSDPHPGV